jgi:hypothetical protein
LCDAPVMSVKVHFDVKERWKQQRKNGEREREREGGYNIEMQLLYVQCSSSTQGEREEYMYTRTNERTMALLQLITTIRC